MAAARDLGTFLQESGGVVAGGMAIDGGAAWLVATVIQDTLTIDVDLRACVERGTGLGATLGFSALILRALGVT